MDTRKLIDDSGDIDVSVALATLDDEDIGDETVEAITELDEEISIDEDVEEEIEDLETLEGAAEIGDELSTEDEALIEREVVKEEVYAEAASAAAPSPAKTRAAPAKPKATRDITDLDPALFVLTTETPADLVANKTAVIARRPAQVKVAEKFDNVLLSVAAEKKPSVYTMKAFDALVKAGTITSADMVKALLGPGCAEGTARSQAGQMMALFPALMIATREGKNLKLNEESVLVEALKILSAS